MEEDYINTVGSKTALNLLTVAQVLVSFVHIMILCVTFFAIAVQWDNMYIYKLAVIHLKFAFPTQILIKYNPTGEHQ